MRVGLASERMVSRVSQRRRRPSRLWRERIREDVARVLRDVDRGGERRHPPACPHVPPLPRVSPICGLLRLRSPARALRFTQLHELRIEKAQPPLCHSPYYHRSHTPSPVTARSAGSAAAYRRAVPSSHLLCTPRPPARTLHCSACGGWRWRRRRHAAAARSRRRAWC